jgi:hypothetical protein
VNKVLIDHTIDASQPHPTNHKITYVHIHQLLKTKSAGFGGLRFLPNTLGDVRA